MKAHPVMDSPKRWITAVGLALILAGIQAALLWGYAGAGIFPALADGIVSIGVLAALACLAWFVVGFVSLLQTDVMIGVSAMLLWLCGCFVFRELMIFESHLPEDTFVRIHRSTIVNVTQIVNL